MERTTKRIRNKQKNPQNRRYVLFSDVHGNYQAAEDFTKAMYGFRANRVFCLGDVVNQGDNYQENRTLGVIQGIPFFRMVKGNHDAILDEDYDFKKMTEDNVSLVRGLEEEVREGNVLATHSSIKHPNRRIQTEERALEEANYVFQGDPSIDFLFFGHTHKPIVYSYNPSTGKIVRHNEKRVEIKEGLKYMVNPGALGICDIPGIKQTLSVVDEKEGEILTYSLDELKKIDLRNRVIQYFNQDIMPRLCGDAWTPRTLQAEIQKLKQIGLGEKITPILTLMKEYETLRIQDREGLNKFSLDLARAISSLRGPEVTKNYGTSNPLDIRKKILNK